MSDPEIRRLCGTGGCDLPIGHEGPCIPRPQLHRAVVETPLVVRRGTLSIAAHAREAVHPFPTETPFEPAMPTIPVCRTIAPKDGGPCACGRFVFLVRR